MGRASRAKQERRARPPGELEDRLRSQLGFLRTSALAFDDGAWDEASRMALTIRILCHRGSGAALLQQLRLLKTTWFYDTASAVHGVTPTGKAFVSAFPATLVETGLSANGTRVRAPLDHRAPSSLTWSRFPQWWNKPVVSADLTRALVGGTVQASTRGDLVLWLANQDGGAHVDPMIDADYDVVRNATFATVHASGSESVIPMPLAASMRQIAHEVLVTFEEYSGIGAPQGDTGGTNERPPRPM